MKKQAEVKEEIEEIKKELDEKVQIFQQLEAQRAAVLREILKLQGVLEYLQKKMVEKDDKT